MNGEQKEWHLTTYRCFREPAANSESGTMEYASSATVATEVVESDGVWLTRRDHVAAPLFLRLSDFGHLLIIQGSEIVESYFLILAKKWIKAVNIDDDLMMYISGSNRIRRLRLTFPLATDARSCYQELAKYVAIKRSANFPGNADINSTVEEEDQIARWLSVMRNGTRNNREVAKAVEAAWDTNWPTERLVDLVKLCLLDANFPGFVQQVQQCLRQLTLIDEGRLHEPNATEE